jgi:hypothetical protein
VHSFLAYKDLAQKPKCLASTGIGKGDISKNAYVTSLMTWSPQQQVWSHGSGVGLVLSPPKFGLT